MTGKSPFLATEEQRAALLALSCSRDRGEADRARAVVLTLAGWTSARIAEAFGVREDTVRLWRNDFMRCGIDVLWASVAPGPPAGEERGSTPRGPAAAEATRGLPAQLDTPPTACRDRSARRRAHQPLATLQGTV